MPTGGDGVKCPPFNMNGIAVPTHIFQNPNENSSHKFDGIACNKADLMNPNSKMVETAT